MTNNITYYTPTLQDTKTGALYRGTEESYITLLNGGAYLLSTKGYLKASEATLRPYPSEKQSIPTFIGNVSLRATLHLIKERELLSRALQREALELNKGIKIDYSTPTIRLSPLHTINGVYTYTIPTTFTPSKPLYSVLPTKEQRATQNVNCSHTPAHSNKFDDNVVLSNDLGTLHAMHRAYFEDKERELPTYTKEEVETDNTDQAYWNRLLSEEGLSTHFESIVGVAQFDGVECASFTEGTIDNETGLPITMEQRVSHLEEVKATRRKDIRATHTKAQREKRNILKERKRATKTKYTKRERAIPPSKR